MLAPLDVKFSELDVVQPDLLVSCGQSFELAFHRGAPDLIVEILSPSTLRHDRIRKLNLYARNEVREYWMVTQHPLLVEVLENVGGAYTTRGVYSESDLLRSPLFPELALDLAEVAVDLPPQPAIEDEVREGRVPLYA